ncbi:hypothetical protein E3E23_07515 [Thermococcus sp. CX2]|uniref:hypothetical protein n=1 Tax=Thermococcus sp. CX2 TaxID=163006 RepID=UPI001438FCC1|nr:hypothetical protein [Thermococcus sp. CX2]NJE85669.1 hypothetical protein [Thermococcus sp. CX2]
MDLRKLISGDLQMVSIEEVGLDPTLFIALIAEPALMVWFFVRIRPRISWLSMFIMGLISFLVIGTFPIVFEMFLTDFESFKNLMAVGFIEEGTKFITIILGLKIFQSEAQWLREKLGMAFFVGIVFGLMEAWVYALNFDTHAIIVILAKMSHAIRAIVMFEGYLLMKNGNKFLGGSMFLASPVLHGLWDFGVVNYENVIALLPFVSELALLSIFYLSTKKLLPLIRAEEEYRQKVMEKSRISVEEHWLKRIGEET